jgi:hypothetical protein
MTPEITRAHLDEALRTVAAVERYLPQFPERRRPLLAVLGRARAAVSHYQQALGGIDDDDSGCVVERRFADDGIHRVPQISI